MQTKNLEEAIEAKKMLATELDQLESTLRNHFDARDLGTEEAKPTEQYVEIINALIGIRDAIVQVALEIMYYELVNATCAWDESMVMIHGHDIDLTEYSHGKQRLHSLTSVVYAKIAQMESAAMASLERVRIYRVVAHARLVIRETKS